MISICCTTHIHISISYTTLFRSRPGTDAEAVGLVGPVPIRSGKVGEVLVLAGIDELEVIVLIIEVLPVEEVDEAAVVGAFGLRPGLWCLHFVALGLLGSRFGVVGGFGILRGCLRLFGGILRSVGLIGLAPAPGEEETCRQGGGRCKNSWSTHFLCLPFRVGRENSPPEHIERSTSTLIAYPGE